MLYRAYLTDGATAARQVVRAAVGGGRIQIQDERGYPLDEWRFDGLKLAEEVYPGAPVRLVHRDRGEACLTVEDHAFLAQLERALPHLRGKNFLRGSTLQRFIGWGGAVVALVAALVIGVPLLAKPLARAVPPEWDTALGRQSVSALTQGDAMCDAPHGRAALDALVARLRATTAFPHELRVEVSPQDEVNAFAAPGGFVVVFDGLLQEAESGEEVAGVLAHELAHVQRRHPTEGLIRALGLRMLLSAIVGDASGLAAGLGSVGEHALEMSYSRADEAEADHIAVRMLNAANIRADGLVAFFERLGKDENSDLHERLAFLSSHPMSRERARAIRALARGSGAALEAEQWTALKAICAPRSDEDTAGSS